MCYVATRHVDLDVLLLILVLFSLFWVGLSINEWMGCLVINYMRLVGLCSILLYLRLCFEILNCAEFLALLLSLLFEALFLSGYCLLAISIFPSGLVCCHVFIEQTVHDITKGLCWFLVWVSGIDIFVAQKFKYIWINRRHRHVTITRCNEFEGRVIEVPLLCIF